MERPAKLDFVLNRKTARALGVEIPPSLLLACGPRDRLKTALDFAIEGSGPLSRAARGRGYRRFAELAEAIRALAYGRAVSAEDIAAVLEAHTGTCSTKHRFLAALAHECGHGEVKLMMGLYPMSEKNTPGVGKVLEAEGLLDIPEAHCYLMHAGVRLDFTGLSPGASSPFDVLIEERVASPADLPAAKRAYHRAAIEAWARRRGLDPERAWAIRERCIAALQSGEKGS